MSSGLVLITGANGYIAAHTVEAFLKAGHSVRGTVRSAKSAAQLHETLSSYGSKFTTVEVPDITLAGAFDEAVKGVDAIAHLASPVSFSFTDPEPVINTTTKSIETILESAAKEPSVKQFVLMSSIVSVLGNPDPTVYKEYTEADWNEFALPAVAQLGKSSPGALIYSASKVASERAFWKFRDERHPAFTMTAVNPVFVIGPPLVQPDSINKLSESYQFIGNIFAGGPLTGLTGTGPSFYVDVRDVAALVVYGVEHPQEANGQRYIARSSQTSPQGFADVLRKAYPERRGIIHEGNPGEGYVAGMEEGFGNVRVDGSKGRKALGRDYIPFETTVLDLGKVLEKLV